LIVQHYLKLTLHAVHKIIKIKRNE